MAKKIITFISVLKPYNGVLPQEKNYYCPNGEDSRPLKGVQTNEAPLKYLLRRDKPIEQILCLCTDEVKQPVQGANGQSSVDYLESKLLEFCEEEQIPHPEPMLTKIDIKPLEENMEQALAGLLEKIRPGDEILIDTTGGPRDANFLTMLIVQTISYVGCTVQSPVYSFFASGENSRIRRLDETRYLMDLTSAVKEFTAYGRVDLLHELLDKEENPAIRDLGEKLKEFSDVLELNQYDEGNSGGSESLDTREEEKDKGGADDPNPLESLLSEINELLDLCTRDETVRPLLKELLPVFRKKMSFQDGRITVPSVVNWCAENHMIQQSLTIYREKVIGYLKDEGIITIKKDRSYQHDNDLSTALAYHCAECCKTGALEMPYLSTKRRGSRENYLRNEGIDPIMQQQIRAFSAPLELGADYDEPVGAMILPLKNGSDRAGTDREKEKKPKKGLYFKPLVKAMWIITRCLFRNTLERRAPRESAREMQRCGHMELLPLLDEPGLSDVHILKDLETWILGEKEYLLKVMNAERLKPMSGILLELLGGEAPWIESEIQDRMTARIGEEWQKNTNAKDEITKKRRSIRNAVNQETIEPLRVSPIDLSLTLMDYYVLRQVRNRVNHASNEAPSAVGAVFNALQEDIKWGDIKAESVKDFLCESAKRLDMLARQAEISRRYLS